MGLEAESREIPARSVNFPLKVPPSYMHRLNTQRLLLQGED